MGPTVFKEWLDWLGEQQLTDRQNLGQGYQVTRDYTLPDAETLSARESYPSLSAVVYDARGLRAGRDHTIRVTYKGVILAYAAPGQELAWSIPEPIAVQAMRAEILNGKQL